MVNLTPTVKKILIKLFVWTQVNLTLVGPGLSPDTSMAVFKTTRVKLIELIFKVVTFFGLGAISAAVMSSTGI